jgi:hypothetical protein
MTKPATVTIEGCTVVTLRWPPDGEYVRLADLGFTAHDVGGLRMAADLARDTQSARWYRDLADRIEVLLADELHER